MVLVVDGAPSQKGVKAENPILRNSGEILYRENSIDHHVVYKPVIVLKGMWVHVKTLKQIWRWLVHIGHIRSSFFNDVMFAVESVVLVLRLGNLEASAVIRKPSVVIVSASAETS